MNYLEIAFLLGTIVAAAISVSIPLAVEVVEAIKKRKHHK